MAEVEERFLSAAEDEDTFTGQLGALLGAGERKVEVDGQPWYWKIEYTKFRGRGRDATEAKIGADGIFEIRLRGLEGGGQKSLLFQSKMGTPRGAEPKRQALKMSNWREAAVFLSYAPRGIRVSTLDQVMGDESSSGKPFSEYFIDDYLACHVGDSDLHYNAQARTLQWRDERGQTVAVRFSIPRRLRVDIDSPYQRNDSPSLIDADQIDQHRMDSEPEDRLALPPTFTQSELKKAQKSAAMLYHPDREPKFTDELKAVMNKRMAEFNDASRVLRKKKGWN
ncbi:MAG: J domain-containing protein [Acidobacteriaceae bacterium]